eukprot:1194758-Prorocentrum_minimum.AAC.9
MNDVMFVNHRILNHVDRPAVTSSVCTLAEAACDAPPCCRANSKHPDKGTDAIGDNIVAPARLFGEYHCDTPLAMLQVTAPSPLSLTD